MEARLLRHQRQAGSSRTKMTRFESPSIQRASVFNHDRSSSGSVSTMYRRRSVGTPRLRFCVSRRDNRSIAAAVERAVLMGALPTLPVPGTSLRCRILRGGNSTMLVCPLRSSVPRAPSCSRSRRVPRGSPFELCHARAPRPRTRILRTTKELGVSPSAFVWRVAAATIALDGGKPNTR